MFFYLVCFPSQLQNDTLIMKCGQNAEWLGVVDLHIRVDTHSVDLSPSGQSPSGTSGHSSSVASSGTSGHPSSVASSQLSNGQQSKRTVRVIPTWQMVANCGIEPDPKCTQIVQKFKVSKKSMFFIQKIQLFFQISQ